MNLATRMTLAISCCALLLFGGSGWLQLRGEERDLRTVAAAAALLLGHSLQTAFENALRDRQIEDVAETLGALSRVDPAVAIFVFDEEGKQVGASEGTHPSRETLRVETRARAQAEPVLEFAPVDAPSILRLGLRLRLETPSSASAIVLEKPLTEMQRDLSATRRSIAVTSTLFMVAVAGLTWLLTRRYVGSPLAGLVANMREVRAGNLRISAARAAADEVGAAQAEFEQLVVDLDAARMRADQEFEARRRIERGLQDADKLITLGQLSAVMAHEIGSPLQTLEGRARALRKHAHDAEMTCRTADILVEQTERITRIVGQMLSITRRRPPARTLLDAERSIGSVVALLELEARRRQVNIQVERAGRSDVFADPDQLQQVVLNLMRNALDAAPPGTAIQVRFGGDDVNLVFDVRDAGHGIAEAARPHLFEPFFTTKASAGGSGLGLSVVRSIVQEHCGRVEFVEDGPCGCLVRVSLPRAHQDVRA